MSCRPHISADIIIISNGSRFWQLHRDYKRTLPTGRQAPPIPHPEWTLTGLAVYCPVPSNIYYASGALLFHTFFAVQVHLATARSVAELWFLFAYFCPNYPWRLPRTHCYRTRWPKCPTGSFFSLLLVHCRVIGDISVVRACAGVHLLSR